MIYIFCCTYICFNLFFVFYYYKRDYFAPLMIFLIFQLIMYVGLIKIVDFNNSSDLKLIFLYFIALFGLIVGDQFVFMRNKKYVKMNYSKLNGTQGERIILLMIFSFMACYFFFTNLGLNLFEMIKSIIAGDLNFSEYRKSVNFAIGSGYIYQFRVFILPFLVFYTIICEKKYLRVLGIILIGPMFFFLIASGQRAGLIKAMCMFGMMILFLNYYGEGKPIWKNKLFIATGILTIILFLLLTILNGRHIVSGSLFGAIYDRFIFDNQYAAKYAFRYIDSEPTQWGRDWYNMFLDILPGKNSYVSIAAKTHAFFYGSYEGTAPPCIWGSTYYNWGILGVFIFSMIIGSVYRQIYEMMFAKPLTKFRLCLFAYLFVSMGMWMADSPMYFFDEGTITFIILYFAVKLFSGRIICLEETG